MRRSYLELLFRHRVLVVVPMLLACVLGTVMGLQKPRDYVSSSTIWVDSAVPNDTTVGSVRAEPPSAGQHALLVELLSTRNFLLTVARSSPLGERMRADTSPSTNAAVQSVSESVAVAATGPHVLTVTVSQPSERRAKGLAKAVVQSFLQARYDTLRTRAAAQVAHSERQAEVAGSQAEATLKALLDYQRVNPVPVGGEADSGATLLASTAATAQERYAEAQKAVGRDAAVLMSVDDQSAVHVIDEPMQAWAQRSRKPVIFGAVGGLLAGLTITVLALLVLMARDRAVRQESDLLVLGLDVVGSIEQVRASRRTKGSVAPRPRGTRRASSATTHSHAHSRGAGTRS